MTADCCSRRQSAGTLSLECKARIQAPVGFESYGAESVWSRRFTAPDGTNVAGTSSRGCRADSRVFFPTTRNSPSFGLPVFFPLILSYAMIALFICHNSMLLAHLSETFPLLVRSPILSVTINSPSPRTCERC